MTEPTNNNNPEENGALNAENGATPVEDTHSTPERKRLTWKPVAAVVTLATAAALGTHFWVLPAINESSANHQLSELAKERGPVQGAPVSMVKYSGETVPGTNKDQKALSPGKTPSFTFTNGKEAPGAKNVEMYIDFSSQPCRDVVLLNQGALASYIEQGKVRLTIHPVPTSNIYNTYSFEALSEGFATEPSKAWPLFTGLLRQGMNYGASKDHSAIAKAVAKVAADSSVSAVDTASITNGTFASWILSGAKDSRLGKGYYPPMIYVNGAAVDTKTNNMNDASAFKKMMEG